jgi:DUF4097 and DUF4098 domain-containing protein YvlB
MNTRILLVALAAAGAAPAFGHGDDGTHAIDETRPLKSDGTLFVSNVAGTIQVQAWDRAEVHVSGEIGDGSEKLEISGDPSNLRVEVKVPKQSHDAEDCLLRLQVPAGVRLDIEAVSADVVVQGTRGPLHAQSVSGDLKLSVEAPEVEAQTVSGSVTLRAPSHNTRVNTVSGDARVSGLRDKLKLETVSGDVGVEGEGLNEMELKSVSGDLAIDPGSLATPKITAETLSGDVHLYLDKEPDALLTLHSFSGDLKSAYGPPVGDSKKRWEATLGGGKGKIDLNSFSGDIVVSRGRR